MIDANEIREAIKQFEEEDYTSIDIEEVLKLALWAVDVAKPALEEFRLGHLHQPNLEHIRIMGDSYGWCDICQTKVSFGPGIAEEALAAWPGNLNNKENIKQSQAQR